MGLYWKEDVKMDNLQEIQILAQLLDNMEIALEKLEKSYKDREGEGFNLAKKEILDTQNKISQIVK